MSETPRTNRSVDARRTGVVPALEPRGVSCSRAKIPLVAFTLAVPAAAIGAVCALVPWGCVRVGRRAAGRGSRAPIAFAVATEHRPGRRHGLLMSTVHLGKPLRFYRGFNNLRHSNLSREGPRHGLLRRGGRRLCHRRFRRLARCCARLRGGCRRRRPRNALHHGPLLPHPGASVLEPLAHRRVVRRRVARPRWLDRFGLVPGWPTLLVAAILAGWDSKPSASSATPGTCATLPRGRGLALRAGRRRSATSTGCAMRSWPAA